MDELIDHLYAILRYIRARLIKWAAHNPMLALAATIIGAGSILPIVSALALLPIVVLINLGNYMESKGLPTILFVVFGQGLTLALVLFILFMLAFLLASSATFLHYYNIS